jgi:hypothetical protein
MANKLNKNRAKQRVISAYLVLLLLAIPSITFQSGVLSLVWLACWGCTVFGCCIYYYKTNCAKRLKINSLHTDRYIEEKEGNGYVS